MAFVLKQDQRGRVVRLAGKSAGTGLRWDSIADFLAGEQGTAAPTEEPLSGVTYSLSSDRDAIALWQPDALTETSEISGSDVASVGVRFPAMGFTIETTVMALCLSLVYGKPIKGKTNWMGWPRACSAHVWEMCACMAPSYETALARVGASQVPKPVAVAFPVQHGGRYTYGIVCRNNSKQTTHVYGYKSKQPFPFQVDSYWTESGRTLPMSEAQVVARMLAFAEMYPTNRDTYPWYDWQSRQYTYASAAPYTHLQMETYVDVVRRNMEAGDQERMILWQYNAIFEHVTADGGITNKDVEEYVPHGPFMLYDKGKAGTRVHPPQRHGPAELFAHTQISFDALYIRHARYVLAGRARYYIADQASGTYNLMLKLQTDAADAPVALRVHWRKGRRTSVAQDFALSQKLAAHGVGPKVYSLHDVDGHAAFSTEYYNKKALEAGSRVDGLEDALVELYVRLSTIMQCTDTKPANVVMQQQNTRTNIAVIDPSGCTVVEKGATFIGPVDMYDLDVALKSGTASRPFALASICLLVYVIVARLVSPNVMPGVARVLLENLANVEGLVTEHDKGRDPDHTAKYMLDEYMGTSKNKRSMQDFLASKQVDWKPYENGPSKHAVAYWRGKGMILDDPSDAEGGAMFERVHGAILAQAQRDTSNRADTGTVERHARRVAARIAATPLVPGMDDTGIQAHLRVDRLTAMVVHGLSKNPGTDLESLYGPLVKLTGAESAESEYELLADGKHNVVFASRDTVLRVNKKPGDANGLEREAAVSRLLHEHAIGPRVLGTYMLGAHAAVALERYVHGSLDAVFADREGSKRLTNLRDALVELYARLATVAMCVDTKPGNVVLSDDSKLGVIDVDLCVRNPSGVAYIGPIDLHDLEAMLAREDRERKGMSIADFEQKPLLFAAIALTIFVVAAGSHVPDIADIASVLLRHFKFVWHLFTVFDTGITKRKRRFGAIRALKHYAGITEQTSDEDAKPAVKRMLEQRSARGARTVHSSHSAAYWTGEARMIRDAERDDAGGAAHLEAALRIAATTRYGAVSESVVRGHARAVAARVAGEDVSRMSAVEIQETFRVDRLTADVLESRDRPQQQEPEPEPEPASLYTEGPAFESAPLAQTERGKEREGASASAEGTFAADLLSALRAACAKGLR
jgi:predicted Ser/Thr protein kinase